MIIDRLQFYIDNEASSVYVANDGDDLLNDGSIDKPFKSIVKALQYNRTSLLPLNILLKSNIYVDDTINIENSIRPIKITSYGEDRKTIYGGSKITDYTFADGIIEFDIPYMPYAVSINGERISLSEHCSLRTPDNFYKLTSFSTLSDCTDSDEGEYRLTIDGTPDIEFTKDTVFSLYYKWLNEMLHFDRKDGDAYICKGYMIPKQQASHVYPLYDSEVEVRILNNVNYLEENTFSYEKTEDNMYHVKCKVKNTSVITELVASKISIILNINDSSNITVRNVTLSTTSENLFRIKGQGNNKANCAITINNSANIVIDSNILSNIGGYCIGIRKNVRNVFINNNGFIDNLGGAIILINNSGNDVHNINAISIHNNVINGYGLLDSSSVGILAAHGYNLSITNNTIFDGFYTAISFGWSWGFAKSYSCKGRKNNNYTRYWDYQFCKLERFFVWAFSRKFIHSIPLPKIRPTIRHDFTPYIYSTDELNKIFATALCYRQRYNIEYPYVIQTMLKLTYCLGLRSGETTRLLVEDIDLNNDLLYINETKFHKSRLVTANAPVMKMLKLYLDWRKSIVKENHFVNNHLFLDKRGNGVPQHELQQAFRLICTKANIVRKDGKNVRLHDLRHSFATHRLVKWYKEGADVQTLLPVLSTYLGHSHLEDTSIYLSMTHELLDKANIRFKTYVES